MSNLLFTTGIRANTAQILFTILATGAYTLRPTEAASFGVVDFDSFAAELVEAGRLIGHDLEWKRDGAFVTVIDMNF